MDKRMCWLALCWLLGGCLDKPNNDTATVSGYPRPKPGTYMTQWDKVDLNEVFKSKRLMRHYFNCLVDKGPCPPDARELKRALPEALENGCAKCSKSQLDAAIKIIHHLREFEPVKFEILANKFDPKGIYRKRYLDSTPNETNNSIIDENSIDENNQKLMRLLKRHRRRA
ncbi:allergen Tha p 1-like [Phymastichus coffea]|uniref:allergen Tha p 1-like n=1 Tax=Phymastichus coffea TaxID=108790 RepID=UPI00273C3503|nr:allergen Tha p 1-like [Phymastichus coffea]